MASPFFDPLRAWALSRVPTSAGAAEVVEIVSGDSFRMKLRGEVLLVSLVGVVAPESNETRWPGACYAEESRAQLVSVLPEGTILFVDDGNAGDLGQGPILAYLWLADRGDQRAFLINELIVADGDAVADLPISDSEIGAKIQVAENEARAERAGLWGACSAADEPAAGATPDQR